MAKLTRNLVITPFSNCDTINLVCNGVVLAINNIDFILIYPQRNGLIMLKICFFVIRIYNFHLDPKAIDLKLAKSATVKFASTLVV